MHSVLLTLALSCAPQEEASLQPITLEFGWPDQGEVLVVEETLKKGSRMKASYRLSWEPVKEGEGFALEYKDYMFLELDGRDVTGSHLQEKLAPVLAMTQSLPKMIIAPDGSLAGFEEFDAMIERLLGSEAFTKNLKEEDIENVRQALSRPEVQTMMRDRYGEIWTNWVGMWTGLEVTRGDKSVIGLDMEISGGVIPELLFEYGDRKESRGKECVEIKMTGIADESALRESVAGLMGNLAPDAAGEAIQGIEKVARTDTCRSILCLDGLRPSEVFTSSKTQITMEGAEAPTVTLEEHRYMFYWDDLQDIEFEDGDLR